MNIKKIQKELDEVYGGRIHAEYLDGTQSYNDEKACYNDDASVRLTGELDNWEDILRACSMAVDPKVNKSGCLKPVHHVVNEIELTGVSMDERNKTRIPQLTDDSLEGTRPDVLVIGGGISGASIARELSGYKLDVLLIDKESDLAMHSSGRNDGQVHPGVDLTHPCLKLKYVRKGNDIYDTVCEELGVPFKWIGQYVGFSGKFTRPLLEAFAWRKRQLGIKDTEIVSAEELYKAQPEMNPGCSCALLNKRVGVVCPYGLTIAYAENAVQNGSRVSLNTAVLGMELEKTGGVRPERIKAVKTNRGTIYPKLVINAAGTFSDIIADMADDKFFSIHPRRGTIAILDRKANHLTSSIVGVKNLVNKGKSHTKGGGVMRTAHDNILVGPDAIETYKREDFASYSDSIGNIFDKQRNAFGGLAERDIITYFTGVRGPSFEEDFVIERGRRTKNIIHVAAIQSPGLTAAPAIAKDVELLACSVLRELGCRVESDSSYNPIRKAIPAVRELPDEERDALIKENPDYGVIVCRCEEISKGEIIDCLKSPIVVPTVDGIKKRVRPGMGRCQGGFCSPVVAKIISEYMDVPVSEVTKNGEGSVMLYGRTK